MYKQNSKTKLFKKTHISPLFTHFSKPTSHFSTLTSPKAITLVALVVTIVVLLILASVTITSLLGDNGIIKKAQEVANATKKSQIIENVQLDILMAQLEGNLTQEKLEEILGNYGEIQYDEEGNITGLKPDGLEETIPIEDLLTGEVSEEEPVTPDTTAPTANISLNTTSTTPGTAIEATVTHSDSESGVSIANCKYIYDTTSGNLGIDSTSWESANTFDNNPQTLSLTAGAEGTYYLHVLTVDVAGNKAETISEAITIEEDGITAEDIAEEILTNPETYYGKTVSGYTCTNSSAVNNWKIFYAGNDFSADGSYHIYLISDYYIPYASIPKTSAGRSLTKGNYSHTAYWSTTALNNYTGSGSVTNSDIKNLNNDYFNVKSYPSTSNNMKAVAYMLDTNAWSVYKGEDADYAVGGPSIEMIMKSYSQKHGVDYRAQASSATGYQVSNNGGASWANYINNMLSTTDSLYVLTDTVAAYGYWVSSPSADLAGNVMYVDYNGYVSNLSYRGSDLGFRPLVCLSSDVKFEMQTDGTLAIK